jgi:hypothetical protein
MGRSRLTTLPRVIIHVTLSHGTNKMPHVSVLTKWQIIGISPFTHVILSCPIGRPAWPHRPLPQNDRSGLIILS